MSSYDKPKRDFDTSYVLAGFGPRLVSAIIDGLIVGFIGALLFGAGRGTGGLIGALVGLAYYWYCWTRQDGQTFGKKIMNLRVIKADGSPMTDSDAVVRYIGYYVNSFVFCLGWIWALFDSKSQGWHDKMANTYVVTAED